MKRTLILHSILLLLLQSSYVYSQIPNLDWAKSIGGTGDDIGESTAVDNSGNIIIAGNFENSCDFDPGAGIHSLNSHGNSDVFIEKLDAGGNFIWAKTFGGTGIDYVYSMAIDQSGNVYAAGFFSGTVDFDPDAGVYNLSTNGSSDIFIEKLDSNGNFIAVKSIGGTGYDEANGITVDLSGNIYITGSFADTVDFDPGPGTYNLTETYGRSIYVLKLDNLLNFSFADAITGTGGGYGISISCDGQSNALVTGFYVGTVDFDPGPAVFSLTNIGQWGDIFVLKLDIIGNMQWVKSIGNLKENNSYSIKSDSLGSVYTAGYLLDTIDFDPGPGIFNLVSKGSNDVFIQKLDPAGNLIWAKSFGGKSTEDVNNMTLDNLGNIYIPGSFYDTVDFDPGPGLYNLYSDKFHSDIYVLKLNASGNFVWAVGIGNSTTGGDGWAVSTNSNGDVFATGYYDGTMDFDPNAGISNLTSSGQGDVFILKLNQGTSGIYQNEVESLFSIYPNPTSKSISIQAGLNFRFCEMEISNATGQLLERKSFPESYSIQMDIPGPNGLYFIKVMDKNGNQFMRKACKM